MVSRSCSTAPCGAVMDIVIYLGLCLVEVEVENFGQTDQDLHCGAKITQDEMEFSRWTRLDHAIPAWRYIA